MQKTRNPRHPNVACQESTSPAGGLPRATLAGAGLAHALVGHEAVGRVALAKGRTGRRHEAPGPGRSKKIVFLFCCEHAVGVNPVTSQRSESGAGRDGVAAPGRRCHG